MANKIDVLDKGFVEYVDHLGSDSRIVEAARISYRGESKGEEKDRKLLEYLYRSSHSSPFEQCSITYRIKLPIFVQAQLVRQRCFRLNQVSARYTEMPDEFYIPEEWRMQDFKNKQGSLLIEGYGDPNLVVPLLGDLNHMGEGSATTYLEETCAYCYEVYKSMIEAGIAREMARMVLPQNIYTSIYLNCDLNNLMKFFRQRLDEHAQWEIRQYAKAMFQIFTDIFPWTAVAYEKYKWEVKQ